MKTSAPLLLGLTSLLMLAAGCVTTRPPERFPDLTAEDAPRAELATVREADHCYVAAVDDQYIVQYDINPIALATYRQHLLPAGRHTLSVFYREQRNFETIAAGPRYVTVDLRAGGEYELRSNANGADLPFVTRLRTANWRPTVVDARTSERVAIANINGR